MIYNTFFYLILLFVVGNYLLGVILDCLNRKAATPELPESLQGFYDKDKYAKQQNYFKINNRFSLFSGTFDLCVMLVMLIIGGFGMLNDFALSFDYGQIMTSLIFFGIIFLATDLIGLPFGIYDTFVIEQRFGFNKTSVITFVTDHLKNWFLALVLGAPLLYLIIWLYYQFGVSFCIYAWVLLSLVSIFISMFYSQLIVPMFNKQTPLEAGELRTAIENFCSKAGFKLDNVYVIDGSKRTTKANAYFTGLGSKKRIVLYDNLINELDTDEIIAVLAHEVGHYKHRHTRWAMLMSLVNTFLLFWLFSILIDNTALANALGSNVSSFQIGLVGFSLLFTPVSLITGLLMNYISRRNEYQADAFAAKYGLAEALISGLKKISVKSLSNLTPAPVYVFVHYSHPTLLQRISHLKRLS